MKKLGLIFEISMTTALTMTNNSPFYLSKFTLNDIDFYCSDEHLEDFKFDREPSHLEIFINQSVQDFLEKDPKKKELVSLYTKKIDLDRKAILLAHGSYDHHRWMYSSGEHQIPVQRWINHIDGKYGILILECCNPYGLEIHSNISAILVPNAVYSGALQNLGDVQVELFIPKIGYIDSYTIDYELEQMRKNVEKR